MLKTLWRTFLLVVLGLAVLGAMAAWVKLTQDRPAADDPLRVSVAKDIVLPWEETELWLDYSGVEGEAVPQPPKPRNESILFLLDTSGSMDEYRDETLNAVFEMQRNIAAGGGTPRIGIMEFGSSAAVVSPFTSDMAELEQRLKGPWPGVGGGTLFLQGLNGALAMLGSEGRPGTVIMLTDGGAAESGADLARFYQDRWRPSGNELYLVGIGADASDPAVFYSLTDDPARYIISSTDTGIINQLFQEVAARISNALGRNVDLRVPLAQPLWNWGTSRGDEDPRAARRPIAPESDAAEHFHPGILFKRAYQWRIPIDPEIGGILPTLHAPPELRYATPNGDVLRVASSNTSVPKVLVVTWLFLFMLMLPALVYLLGELLARLFRRSGEIPDLAPVKWRKEYRPSPNLPLRFAPDTQRIEWTPSLLIGLGRSGRQVLTQLRQNLSDSFDRIESRPVLLALDVARDELRDGGEAASGCLETLAPDQVFLLPPESCALYDAVHQQQARVRTDSDDPAAALDLTPYEGMGADALRLSKGTQGQAPLARLALLNDLARGADSALLDRLDVALRQWRGISPGVRARQIVLVANVGGGIGSGWLTDLVILIRRLVAADEAMGRSVELNLLLLGEESMKRGDLVPLNAPTLFAELDRLAAAGLRPFRHRLAKPAADEDLDADSPAAALDGWVRKRPQDNVFVLPSRRRAGTDPYPDAADALALLIDQRRRNELTYQLQSIQGAEAGKRAVSGRECYTQIAIHNAVFPRSFFRELLLKRLVNLLGSRQLLFPELDAAGDRPRFAAIPVDAQALCGLATDDDPAGIGAALCAAGLGRCDTLQRLSLDADSLSETANAMRLILISNANRDLRTGTIGLIGLANTAGAMGDQLKACADQLGGSGTLAAMAESMYSVRRQAHAWIELFFGSSVLMDLGQQPVLAGQAGLLAARSGDFDAIVSSLAQWDRAGSRVLLAPLGAGDLEDRPALEQKLDGLLLAFVQRWLATDNNLAEALFERCGWELTAPGPNGEPIGIQLVLRGTQTRRYAPTVADLRRFEADLREETEPVIDRSDEFHILAMLHGSLDGDRTERALVPFVERLKGPLRGERSSLLATVPDSKRITDPQLRELHARLVKTFEDTTVNAAERVKVVGVLDRNRISVLQMLPLLQSDLHPDRSGGERAVVHRPERRLMRETEGFADAINRDGIELPAVLGIALEDRGRLRRFAELYQNGQVRRSDMDGLWYVHGPAGLVRLSLLETQPLADAAASYVAQGLDIAVDEASRSAPDPDDDEGDFMDYLAWLARQ